MKGRIVISKSGRRYYSYYQHRPKSDKPKKTILLITKNGRHYRGYPRKGTRNPLRTRLRRDNYSCQLCGVHISAKKLVIHHKDGRGYGVIRTPDNDLSNLITLCDKCHMRLHRNFYARQQLIKEMRDDGATLHEIGRLIGVSRQRIHQILHNN